MFSYLWYCLEFVSSSFNGTITSRSNGTTSVGQSQSSVGLTNALVRFTNRTQTDENCYLIVLKFTDI